MQKDRAPIPPHRKRIYWALLLLMCVGMVWFFANLISYSASLHYVLSRSLRLDTEYEALSKKYDADINQLNKAYSLQNTYGFTDINHAYDAPDSVLRIAILGDSYIWGDGLHYTQTWNHLLAARLNLEYSNVEVLHWGRNGWNYPDHHRWVVEEGKKFKVDLVLLGWCDNDLFGQGWDSLNRLQAMYSNQSFTDKFNNLVLNENNLKAYIGSLVAIRDTLANQNARFVVFLGTHPPLDYGYERSLLRRRFTQAEIEFYDPQSYLQDVFSLTLTGDPRLNANGVNGHSGFLPNYFKADAALKWLKAQPLMTRARARRLPHSLTVDKWKAQ